MPKNQGPPLPAAPPPGSLTCRLFSLLGQKKALMFPIKSLPVSPRPAEGRPGAESGDTPRCVRGESLVALGRGGGRCGGHAQPLPCPAAAPALPSAPRITLGCFGVREPGSVCPTAAPAWKPAPAQREETGAGLFLQGALGLPTAGPPTVCVSGAGWGMCW